MRSAGTGALLLGVAGIAAAALVGDTGCSANKPTEIVPGAMTQVRVPKDLAAIQIEVKANGVQKFCQGYEVDTGGIVLLPSTLGVISGAANTTVRITVRGYDTATSPDVQGCGGLGVDDPGNSNTPGPGPRVLRRATLTYVDKHTLFLPMQLSFACYDKADCPPDTDTCIAGQCVPDNVDANTLVDYDPSLLDGTQVCFSPSTCFPPPPGTADATVVDASTCTYSVPAGTPAGVPLSNLNVRIAYAQGTWSKDPGTGEQVYAVGAPFEEEVLSADPIEGYTVDSSHPGQFKLADGLCGLVKNATPSSKTGTGSVPVISNVQVALGCAPKALLLPFCSADQNKNVNDDAGLVSCGVAAPLTESSSAVYVLVDNSVAMDAAFGPSGYATAMALSFADPVFKKTYVAFDFLHHDNTECGASTTKYTAPSVTDFDLSGNVQGKVAPVVLNPTFPDKNNPGTPLPLDLGAALDTNAGAYRRISDFVKLVVANTKTQNPINEPSLMVVVNRIPVDPNALADAGAPDAGGLDPRNVGADCPFTGAPDVQTALGNQVAAAAKAGLHTFFVVLDNHQHNGAGTVAFFNAVHDKAVSAGAATSDVDVVDATSQNSTLVFQAFQSKVGGAVTCAYDLPPGIDTTATLTVMVPPNTPGFPPSTVPVPVPIKQASGCTLATKTSSTVDGWNIDNGRVVICGNSCAEVQAAIGGAVQNAYQQAGVLTDAGINFDGGNINVPDVPVSATMPCK
jgi:hypothetical protein